jgi:PKD repeat protein
LVPGPNRSRRNWTLLGVSAFIVGLAGILFSAAAGFTIGVVVGVALTVAGVLTVAKRPGRNIPVPRVEGDTDAIRTASFNATADAGVAPLHVQFDASALPTVDGPIADYSWDFGDGDSGSGAVVDHTYTKPGAFTVRLTVTASSGNTATLQQIVTISSPPAANYLPLLAEIGPADGAVVHGTEAWVRWNPAVNARGQVLWREKGAGDFRAVDAVGTDLIAGRLGPLQPDQDYEYVVEQRVNGSLERSNLRGFTVRTGPRFEPQAVDRTIARDYNQSVLLTLHNASAANVTVAGRVLAQFDDLPADLVGPGSLDEPVSLAPNKTVELELAVHAADAAMQTYVIPVEAAGAFATARIRVPAPPLELACEVVSEDPRTLAKNLKIRNNGATVADLQVRIASPNEGDVRQQPDVTHAYLQRGEVLDIIARPVLYLEFDSLKVDLECRGAGQSTRFPLEFVAPPGKRLMGIRTATGASCVARDKYCVNNPHICTTCSGPPGNGPASEPSGPLVPEAPMLT